MERWTDEHQNDKALFGYTPWNEIIKFNERKKELMVSSAMRYVMLVKSSVLPIHEEVFCIKLCSMSCLQTI